MLILTFLYLLPIVSTNDLEKTSKVANSGVAKILGLDRRAISNLSS